MAFPGCAIGLFVPPSAIAPTTKPVSTFDPKSIPGILGWYKADVGIVLNGSTVSTWLDQSGNNNHLVQTNSAYQPTLINNALNNLPAVKFGNSFFNLTNGLFTQTFSVFCILKPNTEGGSQTIVGSIGGGFQYCASSQGQFCNKTFVVYMGGDSTPITSDKFNQINVRYDSTNLDFRLNKVATSTTNYPTNFGNPSVSVIGRSAANSSEYFKGHLVELLIYPALSPTQITLVEDYLADRLSAIATPATTSTTKTLTYAADGDTNGVAYWLGTNYGKEAWTNPHTAGRVTCSIIQPFDSNRPPYLLVDRQPSSDPATSDSPNSKMRIDLGANNKLQPNRYSLRGADRGSLHLRSWKLKGTNDDTFTNWDVLDTQTNNPAINQNTWFSGTASATTGYRYLEIEQTGFSSGSSLNILTLGEWEFYGTLTTTNVNISTPTDPYFNNVVLLSHFDGSDNSTTFTDVKGKTITTISGTVISTSQSKFGGSSAYFTGYSYLRMLDSDDWAFGNGDFTIEFWMRGTLPASSGPQQILGQWGPGGYGFQIVLNTAGSIGLNYGNGGSVGTAVSSNNSYVANTWQHIAFSRASGVAYCFVDGVLQNTVSNSQSYNNSNEQLIVGRNNDAGGVWYFNGYLDELRITKGIARYTQNFTPPTAAFADS